MRPNPLHDAWQFLTQPAWFTLAYWVLLLIAILAAIRTWRAEEPPPHLRAIGIWALRIVMGTMWWQQTLWKIPPNYGGLVYWMQQVADHAAIGLQADLMRDVVLPRIGLFGPLVYLTELLIAVSLLLGLFSRGGAILGALMAINLWLGLYSAPGEWPWTYGFLIIIQLLFAIDPPGRALGLDAWLMQRRRAGNRTRFSRLS